MFSNANEPTVWKRIISFGNRYITKKHCGVLVMVVFCELQSEWDDVRFMGFSVLDGPLASQLKADTKTLSSVCGFR